jgi:hypothetical protein
MGTKYKLIVNPSAAKKVEDSAPKEWVIQAACLKLKGDR